LILIHQTQEKRHVENTKTNRLDTLTGNNFYRATKCKTWLLITAMIIIALAGVTGTLQKVLQCGRG
jgi:type II secretory pathway component PulL